MEILWDHSIIDIQLVVTWFEFMILILKRKILFNLIKSDFKYLWGYWTTRVLWQVLACSLGVSVKSNPKFVSICLPTFSRKFFDFWVQLVLTANNLFAAQYHCMVVGRLQYLYCKRSNLKSNTQINGILHVMHLLRQIKYKTFSLKFLFSDVFDKICINSGIYFSIIYTH